MPRVFLLLPMLIVFAVAADAQTIVINPDKSAVLPPSAASAEPVRISVGVSTFVPTPSGDSEQALKAQEDGRRMIYQIAGRECAIMREVLASDCRIDSININVQHVAANRNFNEPKVDGFNINGNISYRISPK